MKTIPHLILLIAFIISSNVSFSQRAELHIENKSTRILTVKVMRYGLQQNDKKHSQFVIHPNSTKTEYFSQTGNFYLKTKATKQGKDPIFKLGDPFEVYVGRDGYSVLTITYSITETNIKNPMDGKSISESEFKKDN